jgi:hypothetical protein
MACAISRAQASAGIASARRFLTAGSRGGLPAHDPCEHGVDGVRRRWVGLVSPSSEFSFESTVEEGGE